MVVFGNVAGAQNAKHEYAFVHVQDIQQSGVYVQVLRNKWNLPILAYRPIADVSSTFLRDYVYC